MLSDDSTRHIDLNHPLVRMPPHKSAAVVASASKACFIKVPRMRSTSDYQHFLKDFLRVRHDKEVFLQSGKDVVGQCSRLQATQQFLLNNASLKRAMAEVNSDICIINAG